MKDKAVDCNIPDQSQSSMSLTPSTPVLKWKVISSQESDPSYQPSELTETSQSDDSQPKQDWLVVVYTVIGHL